MSRKVINITHSANKYDILSQTPKNYDKDNYFLKELQDKVNAEWNYRPNRVDVEYEDQWGKLTWSPLEVVVQSVLSEKGTAISNDTRNIVFRNILEDRFEIGSRFRFSEDYNMSKAEEMKNVWLVVNLNKVDMTSSVIVERCNGTLGSLVPNGDGTYSRHYEPVIQGKDLSSVNFFYNETVMSPQSQLLVIAQHNEYTKQYHINQRFVIGYDKVYRIKAMNKFYGNSTFNPHNVGLMRIYMEICEDINAYDDFEHRIAYQNDIENVRPVEKHSYSIAFSQPTSIPTYLSTVETSYTPILVDEHGEAVQAQFTLGYELVNLPSAVSINNYVKNEEEAGTFKLTRVRDYVGGDLLLTWSTNDPNGDVQSITFKMYMTDQ